MRNSWKKKREKSRENATYHLLTITKVKIITLLYAYFVFLFTFFTKKSLTQHRLAYGMSCPNLLIIIENKGMFICELFKSFEVVDKVIIAISDY